MINQQIHNYTIISLLGEGGMANVYLAQHQSLGNNVAIKLLKEEFVQHPNIRKRFLSEAKSLAKMNHPNVIKVTDLIDAGDIVAFVMEYIEGKTLEAFLSNSGKLRDNEIDSMFSQMILAVDYVHSQGLIHRDIKPSNFMVTKGGQIKLLDFGIAKNTNESAVDYTKTGLAQQMGTPMYMSPEQVRNTTEITKQSDLYSLGVVLWQLVMNKKPYDSVEFSLPEIQVYILKEPLPLSHTVWDTSIQQATAKNPKQRILEINSKKDVEYKTVSDTVIDKAVRTRSNQDQTGYFKIKIPNIGLGILFFISVLVYILIKGENSENQGAIISDGANSEIVVPTETTDRSDAEIKNPNLDYLKPLPKEKTIDQNKPEILKEEPKQVPKENPKETIKEAPIVSITNLKIGQKYQGGIIFYLDNSEKHGLACTESDLGKFEWQDAINRCRNSKLNGFNDWYLPSKEDLKKLYQLRKTIGGFAFNFYWSSTEDGNVNSWGQDFTNGFNYASYKVNYNYVRAVRAF
jgi:serine/threonine protein kinase